MHNSIYTPTQFCPDCWWVMANLSTSYGACGTQLYVLCTLFIPSTVNFPTVLWSPILAEYSAPSSNTHLSIVRVWSVPSSSILMRLSVLVIFLPFLNHWTFSGLEVTHLKVTFSSSGIVKSLSGVINVTGKAGNHTWTTTHRWTGTIDMLCTKYWQGFRINTQGITNGMHQTYCSFSCFTHRVTGIVWL